MSNRDRALKWNALGLKVLPCYEDDTWVGSKLHQIKTPRLPKGLLGAFTDPEEIDAYWTANPTHLVGVVSEDVIDVLDVDMDSAKGKDGWFHIEKSGVEVPETFCVTTKNGGTHMFYKHVDEAKLGPAQDIALADGTVLYGVDRRSGNSYFIAWSDEVPSSIEELAPTPKWLSIPSKITNRSEFEGTVGEWLASLPEEEPSALMVQAISRIPIREFGHTEMIKRQTEMVRLGAKGETGTVLALLLLKDAWLRPPYDTPENEQEFYAALAGAIDKFGGKPKVDEIQDSDDPLEELVQKYMLQDKARLIANRRILSDSDYSTKELTWDELETNEVPYIVEDLIPVDGLCFLVAKRNMGKTFAYIDMVGCIAMGLPWLGKKTRRVHVTIVIGEGKSGFLERIKTWCDYKGINEEDLKPWVSFADSANLNSSMSLERLTEMTNKNNTELIIFDTWSNVSGTQNEDDAAMNASILNSAMAIRNGMTVLFVHHPRKSSQDGKNPVMRGSGTLEGRADVVLTMFSEKDTFNAATGEKEDWVALSTEMEHAGKNRNAATETIHGLFLKNHGKSKVFVQSKVASYEQGTRKVIQYLRGEMTVKEFATVCKRPETTVRNWLNQAIAEDVAFVNHGVGNKPSTYALFEEPVAIQHDFAELSKQYEESKKRSGKKKMT